MSNIDPARLKQIREMMSETMTTEVALFDSVRRKTNEITLLRRQLYLLQESLHAANAEADFLRWHNKQLTERAAL